MNKIQGWFSLKREREKIKEEEKRKVHGEGRGEDKSRRSLYIEVNKSVLKKKRYRCRGSVFDVCQ